MKLSRLPENPIIRLFMDHWMGQNIKDPSIIEASKGLSNRLGRYYLYFVHHLGAYICLAYADQLISGYSTGKVQPILRPA